MNSQEKIEEFRSVVTALLEWIDAVPKDTVLPSMPGVDRDWVDSVLYRTRPKSSTNHGDRQYTVDDLIDAVLACAEEELKARLSGLNNGFDHPNACVLFGRAKGIALHLHSTHTPNEESK